MKNRSLSNVDLCETRLKGSGEKILHENYKLIYSPLQKFKSTSNFPSLLNIIVFSALNERVYILFDTLHDPLVLSGWLSNYLH